MLPPMYEIYTATIPKSALYEKLASFNPGGGTGYDEQLRLLREDSFTMHQLAARFQACLQILTEHEDLAEDKQRELNDLFFVLTGNLLQEADHFAQKQREHVKQGQRLGEALEAADGEREDLFTLQEQTIHNLRKRVRELERGPQTTDRAIETETRPLVSPSGEAARIKELQAKVIETQRALAAKDVALAEVRRANKRIQAVADELALDNEKMGHTLTDTLKQNQLLISQLENSVPKSQEQALLDQLDKATQKNPSTAPPSPTNKLTLANKFELEYLRSRPTARQQFFRVALWAATLVLPVIDLVSRPFTKDTYLNRVTEQPKKKGIFSALFSSLRGKPPAPPRGMDSPIGTSAPMYDEAGMGDDETTLRRSQNLMHQSKHAKGAAPKPRQKEVTTQKRKRRWFFGG